MLPDFLARLFPSKKNEKRVLIVGLDAAGFNVETVKAPTSGRRGPLYLTCWDVGGCDKIRPLLRHYTEGTEALVWILDSNDRERLAEAKEELKIMLDIVEKDKPSDAKPIPLANKQDLPNAMKLDEVRIQLASFISTRPSCAVFATSLVVENYLTMLTPAMDWLHDSLSEVEPGQLAPKSPPTQTPNDGLAQKLDSWVERASKDLPPGEFLQAFQTINLPSWDHYTHIRIAFTILKTHGRQKGKTMIFDGLEKYIKTSPQTTGRTFHITMTYFWIQIVHFGMQSMPRDIPTESEGNQDFCRFLLLNPFVVDGNLWADYYWKEVIMTPGAKENMVLPDKKSLPNLIARDCVRK